MCVPARLLGFATSEGCVAEIARCNSQQSDFHEGL